MQTNTQITVKIIADSINEQNQRVTTMELEYPRFIHSEFMTHRVFSRNAASSRAIPIQKLMQQVIEDPATPVEWGSNQSGMQAGEEVFDKESCNMAWREAARMAVKSAKKLEALGLHKQIVNRVLEPFQRMKTVVTATDWENFFELRAHKDAQPEIQMLARMMHNAMLVSTPKKITRGEWHLPYITDEMLEKHGLGVCKMISASCCAQVSYRLLDDSVDKATMVYDRLVNSTPIHASPFEHQATPYAEKCCNFNGFKQLRQFIEAGIK